MSVKHSGLLMFSAAIVGLLFVASADGQFVMMPDSSNNRVVTFSATNGSLLNMSYFSIPSGTTPVHAMQVNGEIWISEQIGDKISRYDLIGTPVATITGALDNVRGMEQVGGTVYLCTTGTANGAPGRAVAMFNTSGVGIGTFATPLSSGFGILAHQGGLLVSSDAANDDIHRYSNAGGDLGTFHNSTSFNFGEQMDHALNGDILAAGFSTNAIARMDPNTGAIITSYPASGVRGLYQLSNGNILWTSSAGAFVLDPATGQSTQVYTGGGRFLDTLNIPEPTSAILALAPVLLLARRRSA